MHKFDVHCFNNSRKWELFYVFVTVVPDIKTFDHEIECLFRKVVEALLNTA